MSFKACVSATYSASVLDKVTIGCFLQLQKTIPVLMSMPDALPIEIALIALPLFKFQVYSTSLHHYYDRPITLSTF
jgi:hypothetical protein